MVVAVEVARGPGVHKTAAMGIPNADPRVRELHVPRLGIPLSPRGLRFGELTRPSPDATGQPATVWVSFRVKFSRCHPEGHT